MAKTKISEFSSTAASNTDIDNINIAEGCSPANVNNAIRSLMSQLKNQQDGSSGDNFSVGGNLTVTGTTTLSTATLSTALPVASGGTGATTSTGARTSLSAAKSGANSDITSITGLTTPLTTAQGGTGTASTTFANLTTNVTGTLPVANGGTGATTLTSGSVIVGAGTSTPTFVAPTTTGNCLFTTDGTTWSSTPKITSATAQATTSGTTVDFTSIPSWVKRITVMFGGVSTSGTNDYLIQLGTSGGVVATGYSATAGRLGNGGTAYLTFTTGFPCVYNPTASYTYTGTIVITNITGNTWIGLATIVPSSTGGQITIGSGSIALGATLDRVRLTTVNGTDTFDAGSINIIYE